MEFVVPDAVWPLTLKSCGSIVARTSFSVSLRAADTGASTAVCTSSILPAPLSKTTPLQIAMLVSEPCHAVTICHSMPDGMTDLMACQSIDH